MKKEDEFYIADRQTQKTWAIFSLLYIVLLLWLEPIIDFLMSFSPPPPDETQISAFNQQKIYMTNLAFGAGRCFPILLFIWFGWQSLKSSRLPAKGIKLPFSTKVFKGPLARTAGMIIIGTGLMLLLRELSQLTQTPTMVL